MSGWQTPVQTSGAVVSAEPRSRLLIGALGLGLIVDLAAVVHSASGLSLLEDYAQGSITEADLAAWDTAFAKMGLLQGAVFIASAVIWLAWQHRLVASVAPLGLGAPTASPGKSILWWFVPFANLVMVYRIYSDLQAKFKIPGSLVLVWWLVYLLSGFVTQVASRNWLREFETVDDFNYGVSLWVASDVLSAISGAVAVFFVWRLQAGQSRAIDARGTLIEPPAATAVLTDAQPATVED